MRVIYFRLLSHPSRRILGEGRYACGDEILEPMFDVLAGTSDENIWIVPGTLNPDD